MMQIEDLGIILSPTENEFEKRAVLNPACIAEGDIVHMFYRAINQNNISTIGYCQIKDNKVIRRDNKPLIFPEHNFERSGVEDPRIVYLDGMYYLFYTTYDGYDASAAYAISSDLRNFKKQGPIFPAILYKDASKIFKHAGLPEKYEWYAKHYEEERGQGVSLWQKDVFLLPEKIEGNFFLIHRIMPGIQAISFRNFSDLTEELWRKYLLHMAEFIILDPKYKFENKRIGGGCPPIKTRHGWLLIFHAIEQTNHGKIYHAAAALLDLKNPLHVKARLPFPLFSPEGQDEREGVTNDVVFPTGSILKKDDLFIYYGAADSKIKAKKISVIELINELLKHKT
ncbi:hypothetical protein A3C75_01900 [Candidatus Giovannonibacteria bacterium RIFCSPHIGHO2_02_FULL_44_31]|uniref:Pesticidal protein Cry7Aa n=1 Tax=Candidatus Giovannonibacteria bacterium RIFCSPLOWO2_12_FULL_44_15 TaxID=1798364 RepID=A0A1F5Y1D2_9BACT|nr:MAG: hypothetical protein A3C75_01900 [Candidatus Giovannonibacteria bacterium RIFCSPHIGHO2_02_FULL_44_31]OGF76059.1 MAG: hypothetical protein A3E62_03230 [Candidatus Giovannonibacteria bacterium RIFCSPHIGHO2_12_FULL_44_29]OGF93866.1 MAG: hypothetical protein A3G54_03855 [Candidatus Giovannonibacteria bacterium RIFCSPLOWO2_12_FULL_44_15]